MLNYLLRRTFLFICTMFILTILVFWIHMRLTDIVIPKIIPEYLNYTQKLLHGNFGISSETRLPVINEMQQFFPPTLELVFTSFIISFILGIWLGIYSGLNHHSICDKCIHLYCQITKAIPCFWLGQILIVILSIKYNLFPSMSNISLTTNVPTITNILIIDAFLTNNNDIIADMFKHLFLPLVTLSIIPCAEFTSIARSKTIELARSNFVKTVQCYGKSSFSIAINHILRNLLPDVLPHVSIILCNIFSTCILIEVVFDWPGIGLWLTQSISADDVTVIEVATFTLATGLLVLNYILEVFSALFFHNSNEQYSK
ncbi:MAG: ABC transporter permease subunit [Succinivibrionaceae bacterium]